VKNCLYLTISQVCVYILTCNFLEHNGQIIQNSYGIIDLIFSRFFIPTLHLINFFVIAIPLTHSGYLFLSSIANDSKVATRENNNPPFRLIGAFILSIILIALLFFLAGSIARSQEIVERVEGVTTITERYVVGNLL
jgi:hypothetical protein